MEIAGCPKQRGTLKHFHISIAGNNAVKKLTLIKLSVFAEYARLTILGSEEERGRIRGRILGGCLLLSEEESGAEAKAGL
jgi:hypothetical protein